MMSSQHQIKSIDARSVYLINGFIRLSAIIVPDELIDLILLFYVIIETFDKGICHKNFILSNSKNGQQDTIVTVRNDGWKNIFGSYKIDALKMKNSIIEWTFDVKKNNHRSIISFLLGIVEEVAVNEIDKSCFGLYKEHKNYGCSYSIPRVDDRQLRKSRMMEH